MQGARRAGLTALLLVAACDAAPERPAEPSGRASASASAPTTPAFDQAAIDAVVASHRDEVVQACAAELRRARDTRVDLMFELDVSGAVEDATVAGGGSAERPLRRCIQRLLETWTFPSPGQPRTVQATLVL